MRLISVVLGTKTDRIRFSESEKLLTWGLRLFETITPMKPGTVLISRRVWFGNKQEVNLGTNNTNSMTIPRGQLKNLKVNFVLNEPPLTAPLQQGQEVGTIVFQLDGELFEQRPLIVMDAVQRGSFLNRMYDFLLMKFHY